MERLNKRTLSALLIFFLSALMAGACFLIWQEKKEADNAPPNISENTSINFQNSRKETVDIIMVGDIMLNRGVEYMINKEGKGNFKFPFLRIADDMKAADLLIGNLEGPVSDKGEKVGSIYSFRMNPESINGLGYAGFNVLLLANNHAFDYGREALEDTLKRLKKAGMSYSGAGFDKNEAFSPLIKEIKGIKIGFLDYTNLGSNYWTAGEESSGIAWISENDIEEIKKDIEKAKQQADFLIVFLHAGDEYQAEPSSFQISFAKVAIDSGADLVVEHHPHVVQGSEEYKNKNIFYSLGNFIFDQGFSEETMSGQILKISLYNSSSTIRIKEITALNTKMNEFFQPEIVNQ
ncbi:MAG: CapA family protein [Candidatus Nealsonbacteria bacterium]|nr:CapA family protein [Candidatus Nealsonbacteria bacterium]